MQLWDTAGQERFRRGMVHHYYRHAQAVIFVFDVTDETSFLSLPVWMEECKRHSLGPDVPRALVGNKVDLMDPGDPPGTLEQAQNLAQVHDMSFHLCSAKSGRGDQMDAVVTALAGRVLTRPRRESPTTGSFKLTPTCRAENVLKYRRTCSC